MTIFQMIFRFLYAVLAVAVLTGLLMLLFPVIKNTSDLRERKQTLEQEIAGKEARIQALKAMQDRFVNDPDFVEHTARALGMVAPEETVYTFEERATAPHVRGETGGPR